MIKIDTTSKDAVIVRNRSISRTGDIISNSLVGLSLASLVTGVVLLFTLGSQGKLGVPVGVCLIAALLLMGVSTFMNFASQSGYQRTAALVASRFGYDVRDVYGNVGEAVSEDKLKSFLLTVIQGGDSVATQFVARNSYVYDGVMGTLMFEYDSNSESVELSFFPDSAEGSVRVPIPTVVHNYVDWDSE